MFYGIFKVLYENTLYAKIIFFFLEKKILQNYKQMCGMR